MVKFLISLFNFNNALEEMEYHKLKNNNFFFKHYYIISVLVSGLSFL